MTHPLVDQLHFTRSEWLRALRGTPEEDGAKRLEPMNSIGWIVAHLAWQEQQYFVVRPQGRVAVPEAQTLAPYGGAATTPSMRHATRLWRDVTAAADVWLCALGVEEMLQPLPPPGGKRSNGDAILRVTYHYWHHIGEIMAIRQILGHPRLPQFVGDLEAKAPYRPER